MNFHEYFGRIFNLALIDIIGTLFFSLIIYYYFKFNINIYLYILLIFTFGEIVHVLFEIETPITRMIT